MAVKMDPMSKHGGGTMYGCLTNQYERNFLLEAALNDLRFKELHPPKIKFSAGSRTTKANEARLRATRRFLSTLRAKEEPSFDLRPKLGKIAQYYPSNEVAKVLND